MIIKKTYFLFTFIVLFNSPAYAYLGPGMGGGLIAGILGFLIAIFALIFGILWFPLKRLIKNIKEKKNQLDKKEIDIILAIIFIIIYEFFLYFNILDSFKSSFKIYKKFFLLLTKKKLSDIQKEKLIIIYSKSLLQKSSKILLFFITAGISLFLINYYLDIFMILFSLIGIIKITLIFSIYFIIRSKLRC